MKQKHFIHVKWHPEGIWMRLYNFPVNRWDLQADHRQWLDDLAVPFLDENTAHTFIAIGLASRSGSEAFNQVLSERRALEVFEFLKKRGYGDQVEPKLDKTVIARGEGFARTQEIKDGTEDGYFRAVELWLRKNVGDHKPLPIARPLPANHGMV